MPESLWLLISALTQNRQNKHRIRCMRLMLEIIESCFLQDRKILTKEALGSCW